MNRSQSLAYQSAFRSFVSLEQWRAPHAVTLTMKQGFVAADEQRPMLVSLDAGKASQNFRHFLNLLNREVLGKRASRYGDRLQSIGIIEGGQRKRLHYHAIIDCPRDDLVEIFPSLISNAWGKTQWGQSQIDIQSGADSGWVKYISKFRDKPTYADSFDWDNCYIKDRRV